MGPSAPETDRVVFSTTYAALIGFDSGPNRSKPMGTGPGTGPLRMCRPGVDPVPWAPITRRDTVSANAERQDERCSTGPAQQAGQEDSLLHGQKST